MRNDRDPLNLQSLTLESPPEDAWPAIESRLTVPRRRPAMHGRYWLAAAATLLLSAGLALMLALRTDTTISPELGQWIRYSMDLEDQLRSVGDARTRYRGHEALAVTELQLMLAAVDAELEFTPPARQLPLWKQRAVVLNDLLAVQATRGWIAADVPRPVVTRSSPSTLVAYEI